MSSASPVILMYIYNLVSINSLHTKIEDSLETLNIILTLITLCPVSSAILFVVILGNLNLLVKIPVLQLIY